MIRLTDEEIMELDINLKASILAHHAMAVKNGRDPTLETSEALSERRRVAKAQLEKVVEWLEDHNKYEPFSFKDNILEISANDWQALLEEVSDSPE